MKIFGFENYRRKIALGLRYNKKTWKWIPAHKDLINNTKSLLNFNSKVEVHLESQFTNGYSLLIAKKGTLVGSLIKELRKQKKPFLFINWDEFLSEGTVYFDEYTKKNLIRYKKHTFDLNKVRNVYIERASLLEVFYFKRARFTNKEKVFLARWIEALQTLQYVCKNANWIPCKPLDLIFEQYKYGELLAARDMGFSIPKMLFTNDNREVQKFLFANKALLKESGIKFFENTKGELQIFDAPVVLPQNKMLSSIQHTPCMFQQFIDKQYDIRALVIGRKVLSAKIDSQLHTKAKGDWRGQEHLVPFKPYKLPLNIQNKLKKYAQKMNYNLASFDLVRGKDGEYYFLEMNRPGQWLYIEILSGIPIVKTIISQFK